MIAFLPLALVFAALLPQETLPRDLAGWVRRQDAMVEAGAGEKAVAEAAARVEKEPGSAEALFLLGRVLGNTGNLDGARTRFQAAVDADPAYSPGWRGMALVHLKTKEYVTAAREARRAYELEESPENRILLVQALYENGDRPGAYRILKEALAKTPGDHDLRSYYASRLLNEGLFRDAERELRQVLASDAGHLGARQMLVAALVNTGRREDAAAECREFIKRSPTDPRVRILLRDLLVGLKDYAGAAAVMEEILRLDLTPELRTEAETDAKNLRAAAAQKAAGSASNGGTARPEPRATPGIDEREILLQLGSKDVEVRRAAMRTLCGMRLNFVPRAVQIRAGDEDEEVRLGAMKLIGSFGQPLDLRVLDFVLFQSKQRDPSLPVRARALRAAGTIPCPAGLLLLLRGLEEKEPEILSAVVAGIRDQTGKCLVDDPDAPVPAAEAAAVRERVARWWLGDPTARRWRLKAAKAVADEGIRDLSWYLVPWIQEDDAEIRAAMLGTFAVLSGDPGWKSLPSETKAERETARDRAYAYLAEVEKAERGAVPPAEGEKR